MRLLLPVCPYRATWLNDGHDHPDGTQMDMSLLQQGAVAIGRSQMCCLMPVNDGRVGG